MADRDNYSYFINEEVSTKRLTYSWEECNVISKIFFFLPVISTLILQTKKCIRHHTMGFEENIARLWLLCMPKPKSSDVVLKIAN